MRRRCDEASFGEIHTTTVAIALALFLTSVAVADEKRPIRTFFVTRSLAHDRLLEYLDAAQPEIVQVGNYGAMFHGYADNLRATKSPMMLPVVGERKVLEFQRNLNDQVHSRELKVVGHFRLVKVMGDWEEKSGFVDYYNNRWPKDLLGPKPHAKLSELLQRDANGQPVQVSRYDNAQLTLCLSSPHARQMLKAMLKCAIDHGVDGVITTYNYRFECACPYCQRDFKKWLRSRLSEDEIAHRLGIENLEDHKFSSIPARIPGYPDAEKASDLDWLAMRWGAEHFKQKFDDIFIDYGRSLKKDLIVAQWNHLSHVNIGEERMFLPLTEWGKGENYFWYSGGAAFVGKNLNLAEGKAGDAWLSCLYVRELAGGKPFVMGKYDRIRLAVSMAEGFANGGLGMGRYRGFEEAAGVGVLARHTRFMHKHRHLYDGAQPHADVALVLRRQSVWNRQPEALDDFRGLGQALLERQVLLDVVADEKLSPDRLAKYRAVILPKATALSDDQLAALRNHASGDGLVLQRNGAGSIDESGRPRKDARIRGAVMITADTTKAAADSIVTRVQERGATVIKSPWALRANAYTQPNRVILHLVNYDRDESKDNRLKGPELERPKAVDNVQVNLRLPKSHKVNSITMYSPDDVKPLKLRFQQPNDGRVRFEVPRILVYGIVEVVTDE